MNRDLITNHHKMRRTGVLLLAIFPACTGLCYAQSEEDDARDENVLESVLTNSDDAADVFEPLDINEASEDVLLSIPGMNRQCASSIVTYRVKNKFIRSFSELSRLEGMTGDIMSSLRRHTVIVRSDDFHAGIISYMSMSLQRAPLFDSAYGDYGISNFQKLNLSFGDLKLDAVTDKDPGERSVTEFYSLALSAGNIAGLMSVNLGDYSLSLGSGLLFASGGMISKSAGAITPLFVTCAFALRPYKSKGENKFMRGAAVSMKVFDLNITAFGSSKNLPVRTDSAGLVTSVDYTGLNLPGQTPGSGLAERIGGAVVRYGSPAVNCGMAAAYFSYGRGFSNYYAKEVTALESFARVRLDNLAFAGEALFDKLCSFSANLSLDYDDARFALGVRSLRSRILQNYSGPLSENFPTSPEEGIYFGASLRPVDIVKLGIYYDRFRISPVTRDPERSGEEMFADMYISLSRKKILEGSGTVLYLRYKYKTKEDPYIPIADFPAALSVISGSKQSMRCDFRHRFTSPFSIRVRMERNFVSSGEKGELLLFDGGWRFTKGNVDTRLCFYRTDSYKTAFYTVEKDLPGVAEFTALYGDGARLFLIGSVEIGEVLTLGMKLSRDIYSRDRSITVGSYTRDVAGGTEISMEVGYAFNRGR